MSKTETFETVHGEIEYQTVPCGNCDQNVVVDEADGQCIIDSDHIEWGDGPTFAFPKDQKVPVKAAGPLCPMCSSEGTVIEAECNENPDNEGSYTLRRVVFIAVVAILTGLGVGLVL